jgi:hypothetical protein
MPRARPGEGRRGPPTKFMVARRGGVLEVGRKGLARTVLATYDEKDGGNRGTDDQGVRFYLVCDDGQS